jgi:hypothetical protein
MQNQVQLHFSLLLSMASPNHSFRFCIITYRAASSVFVGIQVETMGGPDAEHGAILSRGGQDDP